MNCRQFSIVSKQKKRFLLCYWHLVLGSFTKLALCALNFALVIFYTRNLQYCIRPMHIIQPWGTYSISKAVIDSCHLSWSCHSSSLRLKMPPFRFVNNSIKNKRISTIFGTQRLHEIYAENCINSLRHLWTAIALPWEVYIQHHLFQLFRLQLNNADIEQMKLCLNRAAEDKSSCERTVLQFYL